MKQWKKDVTFLLNVLEIIRIWYLKILLTSYNSKERVERKEMLGATLKNFLKPLKLFCEMSDIPIPWNKITESIEGKIDDKNSNVWYSADFGKNTETPLQN